MEREIILTMFDRYKDMRYLWDKKDKNFYNKEVRNDGYNLLLDIYKKADKFATLKTLKKKIHNFRTHYVKEYRKAKEYNEFTKDPISYEPSLWYFKALSFLKETCVSSNESERNRLKAEETLSPTSSPLHTIDNPREAPSTEIQKKRRRISKKTETAVKTAEKPIRKIAKEPSNIQNEEWENLGKAIGLQLQDLDKKQLTITQKIISDAIYYAKIGSLTENSYIALKPLDAQDSSELPSTSALSYEDTSCSDYKSPGIVIMECKSSPRSSLGDDCDEDYTL